MLKALCYVVVLIVLSIASFVLSRAGYGVEAFALVLCTGLINRIPSWP